MRVVRIAEVPLEKIILPVGMETRLKLSRVKDLAESCKSLGVMINMPVVDQQYKLWAGRDRMAAALLNRDLTIRVQVMDGTPEEFRELELAENAHRRHDKAEQEQIVKEIVQLRLEREDPALKYIAPAPSAINRIREDAARQLGIKPDSLRRKENRIMKREARAREKAEKLATAPPIETWGMELDPTWSVEIAALMGMLRFLTNQAKALIPRCQALQENGRLPAQKYENIANAARVLYRCIRTSTPFALCPYCKGIDEFQKECEWCDRGGWVSREKIPDVPARYKDPENPVAYYRGTDVSLKTAAE